VGLESQGRHVSRRSTEVRLAATFLHFGIHMGMRTPCMLHVKLDPKAEPGEITNCDQQLFRRMKQLHIHASKKRSVISCLA
jgi:hypothetical protein